MMAAASAEKVKLLIERGADVNAKAKSGYTPLMAAASYGNTLEAARQLVAAGALVNMKGKDKTPMNASPLLHAVVSGEADKVRMLLAQGADPNQWTIVFDIFPATPLMMAVGFGYEPIIRDLVRAGADLHVQDAEGINQVAAAALNGDAAPDGAQLSKTPDFGPLKNLDELEMWPLFFVDRPESRAIRK
jgi:ankyrin repeat protein